MGKKERIARKPIEGRIERINQFLSEYAEHHNGKNDNKTFYEQFGYRMDEFYYLRRKLMDLSRIDYASKVVLHNDPVAQHEYETAPHPYSKASRRLMRSYLKPVVKYIPDRPEDPPVGTEFIIKIDKKALSKAVIESVNDFVMKELDKALVKNIELKAR